MEQTFEELSNNSSWFVNKQLLFQQEMNFPTEEFWTLKQLGKVAEYCPPIPEPSTLGLMLAGLAAIILIVNHKMHKN